LFRVYDAGFSSVGTPQNRLLLLAIICGSMNHSDFPAKDQLSNLTVQGEIFGMRYQIK
jgi:hypothetical protein